MSSTEATSSKTADTEAAPPAVKADDGSLEKLVAQEAQAFQDRVTAAVTSHLPPGDSASELFRSLLPLYPPSSVVSLVTSISALARILVRVRFFFSFLFYYIVFYFLFYFCFILILLLLYIINNMDE